jgi:hypothetical protein
MAGVTHTPTFRPDGSLINTPGYDNATRLLYLPEPGLDIPDVPDAPDADDLAAAVKLIEQMIGDFPFDTPHDRANYIAALITPLLRTIAPPPYKLTAIEARQPGSGKTLLANILRYIHGGVFRSEVPEDDAELRKQVTSILLVTTGPIIVLDNVSGVLRSSTFAGLLTSSVWDDRPLGSTQMVNCINDRMWVITGNNLFVGGDLPRRTLRVAIDPKMPHPETRTNFEIADLETWVKQHRGDVLGALLTIVRSWVVAGMPLATMRTSDSYARWTQVIGGILGHADIDGRFDDPSTHYLVSTDDEEWGDFLAAVHRIYGGTEWTAKELLAGISKFGDNGYQSLQVDDLPSDFVRESSFETVV